MTGLHHKPPRRQPNAVVSLEASRIMRANRSIDTTIEVTLRRALWRAGLRGYRKNVPDLPGKPDIVYGRRRLAIFVHGCFWHRCPRCTPPVPKTNVTFWQNKFAYNKERDSKNIVLLRAKGFRVLVLWECALRKSLSAAVARVQAALRTAPGALNVHGRKEWTVRTLER
jgi:DNA mismatch endonuclease (patch repair protein)